MIASPVADHHYLAGRPQTAERWVGKSSLCPTRPTRSIHVRVSISFNYLPIRNRNSLFTAVSSSAHI